MLIVRMDVNEKHQAAQIVIVRGEQHNRLPQHFWYSYQASDDKGNEYEGEVLHNYDSGAFALTQKVTKAVVSQQKASKV